MEDSSEITPNSSFLSSLQCPGCSDYFTIPIFQCNSGHSICNKCSQKLSHCPICDDQIGRKLRNYHLEQQLSSIDYKCQFSGCTEVIKLASRGKHEEECPFGPNLQCLLQNCKWVGTSNKLLPHLNAKHKIPHYDILGDTAEYSSRLRSSSPSAGCVKLLHTFYVDDLQPCTILTYIFMDGSKNLLYPQFRAISGNPSKFTLTIWNTDSEEIDELVIIGKPKIVKYSLEEERERKMCLALDLEGLINKFAFEDKVEKGHKLLHYRLTVKIAEDNN